MSIIKNGNKIAGNYKIQVATEATTEKSGAIRIATEEEAKAGILENVAITPKQLGEVASSIDVPPATQDTLGLVKPDGETIVIDENGTISAMLSEEYDLPTASTTTLGGVKVDGETITITEDGTLSADIPEVALATLTSAGLVQPDGTSISILNGVISAIAQGGDEWEYSLGTNSYFKHKKSGFMIASGSYSFTIASSTATGSYTKSITYSKPFSNSVIYDTFKSGLSGNTSIVVSPAGSKTGITVNYSFIKGTETKVVVYWLAIGY